MTAKYDVTLNIYVRLVIKGRGSQKPRKLFFNLKGGHGSLGVKWLSKNHEYLLLTPDQVEDFQFHR